MVAISLATYFFDISILNLNANPFGKKGDSEDLFNV